MRKRKRRREFLDTKLGFWKKKEKGIFVKGIENIRFYFATHFAASFIFLTAVAILVIMLLLQQYLKAQYLQYLTEQSYKTEEAVLESLQQNVNNTLRNHIGDGSEMAVSQSIYELAFQADPSINKGMSVANRALELYTVLARYDYSEDIVVAAVVSPEELICQYDRYRGEKYSLWTLENREKVQKMAAQLQSKIDFPRYIEFMEPRTYTGHPDRKVFHVAYPLTGGRESIWKVRYVLMISYDMKFLEEFLNAVEVPEAKYVQGYVADKNGDIIFHSEDRFIGEAAQMLTQEEHLSTISKPLDYFGWTLNVVLDEQEMKEHVDEIYRKGLLFYIVLLIIYILMLAYWLLRLLHPVQMVSKAIQDVGSGEYHRHIEIRGSHEIWQLACEYNRMIDAILSKNEEIERQHQETLRSVEQKHQAEREALESQINAHFICNTIGSIAYEAIEANDHHVSVLLKKLSNILRYTFDQRCQEVYMSQEIAWVDQYLFLQKTRYETKFDYEICFPEVYNQWPCCKLMFQPFVENSICHGFEGMESGGIIRICGEADGERLKIVIEDNGSGIAEDKAELIHEILKNCGQIEFEDRKKVGIGIRNVVTRMRMYYGHDLEVKMKTALGEGTQFTFYIPIPEQELSVEESIEKGGDDRE